MAKNGEREIVVIGGGIIGASIAFHVADRGGRVTVVDRGESEGSATRASLAWINARNKGPRAYHELNRRSMDMWHRFAARLDSAAAMPVWGGQLQWCSERKRMAQMRSQVKRLHEWGYDIRLVTADEIAEMEPGIPVGDCGLGSWSPVDGHVDAPAVAKGCLDRAKERGCTVRTKAVVTGFRRGRGQIDAVVLADGTEIACDVVVLACGPDAHEVGMLAEVPVPHYYTNEATIVSGAVTPIFKRISVLMTPHEDGPAMFVRQLSDGRVMVERAKGNPPGARPGPTDDELERDFGKAVQYLPALEAAGIGEIRRARKPIPNDGKSVLGFATAVKNLYLAVTHSGVTLAPLIGESAALEIVDGVDVKLLKAYRPGRFKGKARFPRTE